jgi:hypothetical protein
VSKHHAVGGIALHSFILVALASWSDTAHASPLFDLTGDTTGTGGLQARSVPAGAAVAYFNPALLTDTPAGMHIGFMLLSQQIAVTLDGRPGTQYAVPDGVANAGRADTSRFDNYPIPTGDLQFGREGDDLTPAFNARPRQGAGTGHETLTYESIGIVVKLFQERLVLGVYGHIPNGDFTRMKAFFNDEREQYFSNSLHPELYGDRMTAPSVAFAAAMKLTDDLSLGVGATLNLQAEVVAPTYVVDAGNLDAILIDMDAKVNVSLAPHVGLSYRLGERLRLSATAHAPRHLELGTKFTFLLATGVEQGSGVSLVLNYSPWQFGAGAAYDLLQGDDQTLTLVGTLVYATWSDYINRQGERPLPSYPWADILSPSLGLRYAVGPVTTFADASWSPTPVPPQTGRTNYVDNARLASSLGGELTFTLFDTDCHVGLQAQAHRLLSRHQNKLPTPTRADGENVTPDLVKDEVPDDAQVSGEPFEGAEGLQTNNPGWPGFASEGWVFASSLYLRVAL